MNLWESAEGSAGTIRKVDGLVSSPLTFGWTGPKVLMEKWFDSDCYLQLMSACWWAMSTKATFVSSGV